jgi:transcriptional regulator with XRE-family HTH domain
MVLLRKVIGDALRARRLAQHRTLREVSTAANVSLGYLSEIERGHKEASSELLASVSDALGARLSDLLGEVSQTFALAEQMESLAEDARTPEPATHEVLVTGAEESREARVPDLAVVDGDVTVEIHSDGPLRTRLTTKRHPPGQRHTDPLLVG